MKALHSSWIRFPGRQARTAGAAALLLALAAGLPGPARAQRLPPDPVDALAQALGRNPDATGAEALQQRERVLTARAKALHSVGDLARALLLDDWTHTHLDPKMDDLDQKVWSGLADRFTADIRGALRPGGDPLRAQAAATLLGEMAGAAQAVGVRVNRVQGRLADLAPELARLTQSREEPPAVRVAALLALGKIAPTAPEGLAAVERVLRSGAVAGRRAAAEALISLIRVPTQATELNVNPVPVRPGAPAESPKVAPIPLDLSERVVPVAALGLEDPDPEVRRLCLEAVHQAALNLREMVLAPAAPVDLFETPDERRQEGGHRGAAGSGTRGLIDALSAAAPAVARMTRNQAADVRVLALQTLEEMGYARQRMNVHQQPVAPPMAPPRRPMKTEAPAPTPVVPVALADEGRRDPLLRGLERVLPALADAVSDPDVRARLAAVDVLETLGPEALPAAPALIRALADVDPFVRWAAARTLGKMVPPDAKRVPPVLVEAVPGLARLLADPDLDLRLAAAQALTNFGPDAAGAVDALAKAVGCGDVEARVAAIGALDAIGVQAAPAIPAVIQALGQEDARLLVAAARLLGRFGDQAARGNLQEVKEQLRQALPPLQALLNSSEPDVRRAASDALLSIVGP
jgi:hypothetical protein